MLSIFDLDGTLIESSTDRADKDFPIVPPLTVTDPNCRVAILRMVGAIQ